MAAGKVTALQAQAHDSQRINLFINGAFALGISLTTLARERLYVGQEITEPDYERIARGEQADKAIQVALRALELRPRSVAELSDRLRTKGFEPDMIEAAISRLQELGLVDDTSFARFWVESRQNSRPRGPSALRDELRRKGLAPTVIAETLEDRELVGDLDEQAMQTARAALRKYARSPDYASFARRMGGMLQRRGYSLGTIRPIITELWQELGRTRDAGE